MDTDPDRLHGVLTGLEAQFGPAVFRDPQRAHNLMVDEYGAEGLAARRDIEMVTAALSSVGFDELTRHDVPAGVAADRLSAQAGLSSGDARWTVDTLRALAAPRPAPNVFAPPSAAAGLTPPTELGEPVPPVTAPTSGGWPRSAKIAVAAAAALVVLVAAAAAFVIVRNGDDAADAAAPAATTSPATTGTVAPGDTTDDELAAAKARVTELEGQLATAQAASADPAVVTDLQTQLAAAQQAATDANTALTQSQAQTAEATGQRDALSVALADAQKTFPVDFGHVAIPQEKYAFNGANTTCTGYNDEYVCDDYGAFEGYIRQPEGEVLFEMPGVALIPLGTEDGLTWRGTADSNFTGLRCDETPLTSKVTITFTPTSFAADPTSHTLKGTVYNAKLSIITDGSRCTKATEVYDGQLTFFGLS